MEKQKLMTDILPCKQYTTVEVAMSVNFDADKESAVLAKYYKVADIEKLFQALANPSNMGKITKAIMFGSPLNLEDLLSTTDLKEIQDVTK